MELRDKVVGYTDEVGVQLPPLHPRCRCAIVYRETGAQSSNIKPNDSSLERRSFAELQSYIGKLDNVTVRKWYTYHDKRIHELLDQTLPMEEKARRAFELRNEYRTQARDLMADQEARRELDRKHPNKTWDETIADKMRRKALTRQEAIADIYETSMKTNAKVNRKLGLE